MNKNILQIDKNNCIVIDDNGQFSIVSSDNKAVEILEKENILLEKEILLNKYNEEIGSALHKFKLNVVTTLIESVLLSWTLFVTISRGYSILEIICAVTFFNLPVTIIFDVLCGSFLGNKKRINELNINKKNLETECLNLQKELICLKENNNFKRIFNKNSNNKISNSETLSINLDNEQISKEKVKKKVLKKY